MHINRFRKRFLKAERGKDFFIRVQVINYSTIIHLSKG